MLHFLHWCYTWPTLLLANQNRVIFSCVLLDWKEQNKNGLISVFACFVEILIIPQTSFLLQLWNYKLTLKFRLKIMSPVIFSSYQRISFSFLPLIKLKHCRGKTCLSKRSKAKRSLTFPMTRAFIIVMMHILNYIEDDCAVLNLN